LSIGSVRRFAFDWRAGIAIVLCLYAAVPLLAAMPAPLQYWPSHLARVDILRQVLDGSAFWQRFYTLNTFLVPDIAQDGLLLLLERLGLSLDAASAIFLLLTYALFVIGFCRLAMSFGAGDETKPLLAAVLFYCGPLFWGLASFVAGVGLMLLMVALWLARADRPVARLFVAVAGGAAIFFCHVIPALLFAGILGCLDLHAIIVATARPERRLARNGTSVAAVATAIILFFVSPVGHDRLWFIGWAGDGTVIGYLHEKASTVAKAFLDGAPASAVALVAAAAILAAMLAVAARVRISAPALLIVFALGAMTFVAPLEIGSGSKIDYRLAFVLGVFAAATTSITWRRTGGRTAAVLLLCCLVTLRSGVIAASWHDQARSLTAVEGEFATLPAGSFVLSAIDRPIQDVSWREFWSLPVFHVETLAARHGFFVPTVFALPSQHALVLKSDFREWDVTAKLPTPDKLEGFLASALPLCPVARRENAAASVYLFVIYPSPENTGRQGRAFGNGLFRLINVCAARPG
jgi:hypothetical protein